MTKTFLSDEIQNRDSVNLKDKQLLEAFAQVERIDENSKEIVKELLDAFIFKAQISTQLNKTNKKPA